MELKMYSDDSKESIQVYFDFFMVLNKYIELAFHQDKDKQEFLKQIAVDLMDKLMKVAEQKKSVKISFNETANILKQKEGIDAIATHKIAGNVENFLAQAKGALDLFSNKLFPEVVNYKGNFNHEKIIKHLKEQENLDKDAKNAISDLLNRDWDIWLRAFIDDRNYHHEENFKISEMRLVNGQPTVILERRDGTKMTTLVEYIEIHWNNLITLMADLVWLSFACKFPFLKSIRVTRTMFISPDSPDFHSQVKQLYFSNGAKILVTAIHY